LLATSLARSRAGKIPQSYLEIPVFQRLRK